MKWQYKVRNMPKKRLPANQLIRGRDVWKKVQKVEPEKGGIAQSRKYGRTYCRRKPRRDAAHREVWGVQARCKRKDGIKRKASAKKWEKMKSILRYAGG